MTRRNPRTPNRRGLLTRDMRTQLVNHTLGGAPVPLVAASVGISVRTLQDWMQRGAAEQDRLDDLAEQGIEDAPVERTMKPYLDLYRELTIARGKAAVRNVGYIQKVAMGGFVTEETTKKYRNDDGQMVEEKTVKRAAPDWRAAAWHLERQHRGQFGKDATQVEIINGAGGELDGAAAPLAIEEASSLANRVRENLAALEAATTKALPPGHGDIIDADVVEQ